METVVFKPKRSDFWWISIAGQVCIYVIMISFMLFSFIVRHDIDMGVFFFLCTFISLIGDSTKMKDALLKKITFTDEIVFEFYLLKPIHQPLNDIVTIGAKEIKFSKYSLDLSYFKNGIECTNLINHLISSGTLHAVPMPGKTKMNQKQKWMSCLSILGLILMFALPIAYGILYSKMPIHFIGLISDSTLIFLLLAGLTILTTTIVKQIEKRRKCKNQ